MYLKMKINVTLCDLFYDNNAFCFGPMSGMIVERFVGNDHNIPGQNDEVIVGQSIAIGHHLRPFNGTGSVIQHNHMHS